MSEIFEGLLWCIALATWLMFLCAYASHSIQPLVQSIRGLLVGLKVKN